MAADPRSVVEYKDLRFLIFDLINGTTVMLKIENQKLAIENELTQRMKGQCQGAACKLFRLN